MPVLSNPKHERFAVEIAKGASADQAYILAGYKEHRSNAARLSANEHVRSRVEQILSGAAKKAEVTIQDIARQLDEDREFARQCNSASAAVTATMGKAKLYGYLTERHQMAGPGPNGEHKLVIVSEIVDVKGSV